MRTLLTMSLLLISSASFAEFGKVVDPDGYVNVRQAKSSSSKIVGRVSSGDFVFIDDEDRYDKWLFSEPSYDGSDSSGYIHNSRIKFINQNDEGRGTEIYMSAFDQSKSKIQFSNENNSVKVTIQAEKFNYPANKHIFTKQYVSGNRDEGFYLTHYKGQDFWGTDGSEPKNTNHYKSINVKLGSRIIDLPNSEIESLFNVNLRRTKVYFDPSTESVYISAMEGDGAGTYRVLFAIEKGQYKGKTVVI